MPEGNGELHGRLLGDLERELIEQVMHQTNGVLVKAAARLGINRNTLHKKLSEFNMEPSPKAVTPDSAEIPG
jgi:DNA-binding protein Fis